MHQWIEKNFSDGDFIYLLVPHTHSLKTGTTKFRHNFVCLLVINIVLDSTQYQLRDLEYRVLLDTFHTNRLKLAFVSTPAGMVNTQQQLNKAPS